MHYATEQFIQHLESEVIERETRAKDFSETAKRYDQQKEWIDVINREHSIARQLRELIEQVKADPRCQ